MNSSTIPSDDDSVVGLDSNTISQESSVPACEKCGAAINSVETFVCRKCGWYASIGSFVELDQEWESASDPNETERVVAQEEERFSLPDWAWLLIACVVTIVGESIAARLLTDSEGTVRTTWSVTQLAIGGVVFVVSHFVAFILLLREDSAAGLLDIVLRPLRPWTRLMRELPKFQWLCHAGVSGLTAVLMSLLVIGAIPYERLLDWGTKKPVKSSLMGAIASQVQDLEGSEEKSLEEAVEELGGSQKLTDENGKKKKVAAEKEPKQRKSEDCVIIGYRANSEGLVYLLVLAGENLGRLQHVGQVMPRLPLNELRELSEQLSAVQTTDPFLKLQMDGITWVKPSLACRVNYARKGKKGRLFDIELETILGAIDLASEKPADPAGEQSPVESE